MGNLSPAEIAIARYDLGLVRDRDPHLIFLDSYITFIQGWLGATDRSRATVLTLFDLYYMRIPEPSNEFASISGIDLSVVSAVVWKSTATPGGRHNVSQYVTEGFGWDAHRALTVQSSYRGTPDVLTCVVRCQSSNSYLLEHGGLDEWGLGV